MEKNTIVTIGPKGLVLVGPLVTNVFGVQGGSSMQYPLWGKGIDEDEYQH